MITDFLSRSLEDTKTLAKEIASELKEGDVICLYGDLGAGKTYLTKFLASYFGIMEDAVTSPTFVYWNKYYGTGITLNHFDFYRIKDPHDVITIGFEDALYEKNSMSVIEWPERIVQLLPEQRIEIKIEKKNDTVRRFSIKSNK